MLGKQCIWLGIPNNLMCDTGSTQHGYIALTEALPYYIRCISCVVPDQCDFG